MAIGLGALRLPPAAFWGMTLREFSALLKGMVPEAGVRLGRGDLSRLMRRFPDA